jgi:Domain of unknown function (DUF5664)
MTLPHDYHERKALPLYDFLTKYFPDAIVELVKVSVEGNKQHNPGEPLHWAREKSTDQLNTAMRHIFDHGMGCTYDVDETMHLAKAAWRLLAEIQLLVEKRQATAKPQSKCLPEVQPRWGGTTAGPVTGPVDNGRVHFKCDLSDDVAPKAHCYCNTCVRVRGDAATRV